VLVNNKIESKFDFKLKTDDVITIKPKSINSTTPLDIIYEDKDIIVVNKPSGLLTMGTKNEKEKTAYHIIREYLSPKNQKVFIVHRLDKDTSGVLIFAKNSEIKDKLQYYWNDITIKRGYYAVIEGTIKPEFGIIRSYLKEEKNTMVHSTKSDKNGKLAITRYKTKTKNKDYSLLEVFLETGRKNQIRVHMSEAGHPVIGDDKYRATKNPIKRLGLHANILELIHPITKETLYFEAPVPKEFNQLFK